VSERRGQITRNEEPTTARWLPSRSRQHLTLPSLSRSRKVRFKPPPPMPPVPPEQPLVGDAIIVEPRQLPRLLSALSNALDVLPQSSWTTHLLHGASNAAFVLNDTKLRDAVSKGALKLRSIESVRRCDSNQEPSD
jgi:hypothetical protein